MNTDCRKCIYFDNDFENAVLTDKPAGGLMPHFCKAFKGKIPHRIWTGEISHDKPIEGDNGICFKLDANKKDIRSDFNDRRKEKADPNLIALLKQKGLTDELIEWTLYGGVMPNKK